MTLRLLLFPLVLFIVSTTHAAPPLRWTADHGDWNEVASWGGTLPSADLYAEVRGKGHPTLSNGEAAVGRLEVGIYSSDDSAFTMTGGSLYAMEILRIGEAKGSHGKMVLTGGRVCATELGIGGLNEGDGTGPPTEGELEIRGGSVLVRYLTLGWNMNSTSRIHIVGSKADDIVALNWLSCSPAGGPLSHTEMAFDLDAHGVTPLTLHNRHGGPHLSRSGQPNQCTLRVTLLDTPPSGDIQLISALDKVVGTFQDLPEGSLVRSSFGGKTYEWQITYHGGVSKCDVTLTGPQLVADDGAKTPYTSGQAARAFTFNPAPFTTSWREMYRLMDQHNEPIGPGTLAFPGAEGCGAYAKGGRGGKALFVTNLNDSGPGSLRSAVMEKGPRTVIFRVGGLIELKSLLDIREPYLTIAGQTAPGDGICLKGAQDTLRLMNTHDIIVRYLRVRTGYTGDGEKNEGDSISCYSVDNFIVDHCSTSWGTDETLSCTQTCDRYTIQWCMIAEGLDFYGHSMASILGGDRSTWHHNLFAHCGTRNPRFAGLCRCDFRNNVVYDWKSAAAYGDLRSVNYVNNFVKPGPSTTQKPPRFMPGDSVPLPGAFYISGNILEGSAEATRDNRLGTGFETETFTDKPNAAPPVITQSAQEAYDTVLQKVGATLPKRDATDARLIDETRQGTGHVIKYEKEVGGWATYASGAAPVDSDNDGIPDEWETAHDLNPHDPTDAEQITADGYSNLEHYLNDLVKGR